MILLKRSYSTVLLLNRYFWIFVCLFLFTGINAQVKGIEDMWKQQIDTTKVDFKKPSYLEASEDDILRMFNKLPSFGMYRDNYIITGIPTNKEINSHTADAKFQISISQRLTKTVLPFNTFLMLTYTQRSFWDIYESSAPFSDINYNPGLLLGKPVVYNNQFRGMATLAFEHESNGKDSINSRSTNYFVLSGAYFFNINFSTQVKLWAGWRGNENKDLFHYRGYGLIAFNFRTMNDLFWISAVINPRNKFQDFNTQLELNYKVNSKSNQYLFLQWYNGYGESLFEYDQYTSMVRIGICIKPPMRNLY